MNKRFNIIQLSGIKGIFFIVFLIGCAIAGFLVFPGWVCMLVWNYAMSHFLDMPSMTILHGIILWCIIALITFQLNKKDFGISFKSVSGDEERINNIIEERKKEERLRRAAISELRSIDEITKIYEKNNQKEDDMKNRSSK